MSWDRALNHPIVLKDGRTVTTLKDVRHLLRAIAPRYRQGAVWRYLGALVTVAAEDRVSTEDVAEVLARALRGAGLL